ncbi:hypothetical protein WJX82_003144 [Trebouxia sp. C0006]
MAERSTYGQKCKDCGHIGFVEDGAAGDVTCQVCGLVAESHVIDVSSEWRAFADSDKPQADRTRVGRATDDLLSEGGIGATIITARLAAVAAAVLLRACRQEGVPRTVMEFEAVVPDATKKDIFKAHKTIEACLQAEEGAVAAAPRRVAVSDHMRRFCSHLGMNQKESRACIDVADNTVPREGTARHNSPWDGKSPNSIAAAIIYMVTQLPAATNKPSTTAIALECSVAEGTLQSTYRDLYTEKAALIPKWFAKAEEMQHLQQPR